MLPIQTPRLFLTEATLADTAFIYELLNSPNWIRYIGDRGVRTQADATRYIRNQLLQSYRYHGYGLYKLILRADNTPIGLCGFIQRDYLDHPDIGFALLPQYEGAGYMYEAAHAILDYGAQQLRLHPILAMTSQDNLKSRNLLSRLGLHECGTVKPPDLQVTFLLFSNE